MTSLHRSALRDITNTSSSLNASTLGSNNNSGLKSILISNNKNGPRDSIKSTTSNTSSILSTSMIIGGGDRLNSSTITSSAAASNQQQSFNFNHMINALVEFFSNENLGIDISMKTFREGDSSKLRFYLNHLFKQIDMNLCVTFPTHSEMKKANQQSNSSNNNSNSSNNNNTTINRHSMVSGLNEELVMELVEFFKIPVSLNKRHFSITPQSNRNWQKMIQQVQIQ
ncbi:predicted protein [Naegleria gruberi]|uniref:Predicted protein n=1 Tax=Naegleria gruberi TaxID=5762 RepID=D2W600_NAEGR|nr:uncharacterized protein NAEGRDRAFT_76843 [Naegleria gruberi]EFC35504.1 predicted protein [Naegleria gruberi]|eukprot:XP_002668248.1 predicted protein [Naegleria gruberi strain NEG-M]